MFANTDHICGGPLLREDDPCITKFGRFLRKYKLNELPQLVNVLKGEMSFVGPRPEVEYYVKLYTEEERKAILSVRPGITDYASIKFHNMEKFFLRGPDHNKIYEEEILPEKLRLQLEYVRTRSSLVDFKILLKTLKSLIMIRSYFCSTQKRQDRRLRVQR
jgi:lipopolysaccharide/colanic/teichoic acid biosynthesis glycosyltransferase